MVNFHAEACKCNKECAEFCEPMESCVSFIARTHEVETKSCEKHYGYSWHADGACLKCNPIVVK